MESSVAGHHRFGAYPFHFCFILRYEYEYDRTGMFRACILRFVG